jgi:biopolymer transport protein ExbD
MRSDASRTTSISWLTKVTASVEWRGINSLRILPGGIHLKPYRGVRLAFALVMILLAVSGCFSRQRSDRGNAVTAEAAVVSMPNEGEIYLGSAKLTLGQLGGRIKSLLQNKALDEQTVYIKASRHLKYGTVVDVIDTIRAAGFDQIGLVSKPSDEPSAKSNGKIEPSRAPTSDEKGTPLPNKAPENRVIVAVASGKRIKLNSLPIRPERLERELTRILEQRVDKTVFIMAKRALLYGEVVQILDIAKGARAQPIGLQIDYLK